MSIANQKGGHVVTMRITRNDSNETTMTLKTPFLKKAENWSCQVTDFFTNKTPDIMPGLGKLNTDWHFRVLPFDGTGVNVNLELPTISENVFIPQDCSTVLQYVEQLQRFFKRYSYIHRRTKDIIDGYGYQNYTQAFPDAINFIPRDIQAAGDVGYEVMFENITPVLRASLNAALKLQIIMEADFCEHFYVEVAPSVAAILGLNPYLLTVGYANGVIFRGPDLPVFANIISGPDNDATFVSTRTVKTLDRRASLDVWASFPITNRIETVNGAEVHEHLLTRFDLTSMKEFTTARDFDNQTLQLREKFQSGMENLTRYNPDYESVYLLPGAIQNVNIVIRTRYFDHTQQYKAVPADFTDGLWHARLMFAKKV